MKVKEFIEWLSAFEDQDADVLIIQHSSGTGYYNQGGSAVEAAFDPREHAEYTDMRGNQFVRPAALYYNARTLLLGRLNG